MRFLAPLIRKVGVSYTGREVIIVTTIVITVLESLSNNNGVSGSENDFSPFQTLSRLFQFSQFVKCWRIFLELNSEGLFRKRKKERNLSLECAFSIKREGNVTKSVMHVQSLFFSPILRSSVMKIIKIQTVRTATKLSKT